MSARLLLTAVAAVGLAFGLLLLAAPARVLDALVVNNDPGSQLSARLYAAELVFLSLATWRVRGRSPEVQRPLIVAHAVQEPLTCAGAVLAGLLTGGLPGLWAVAAVAGFFGVAFVLLARRKGPA
jgi:hypothetical protein